MYTQSIRIPHTYKISHIFGRAGPTQSTIRLGPPCHSVQDACAYLTVALGSLVYTYAIFL